MGTTKRGRSSTTATSATKRPRPELAVPAPHRLVDQLTRAAGPACRHPLEVPLTAVATGVSLLGAPLLVRPFLRHLATADQDKAVSDVRDLWDVMVKEHVFLDGHLDALLGWITRETPDPEDVAALQRCLAVLVDVDLHKTTSQPLVDGELLGPVYTFLRSQGSQKAAGAFFTPMTVCTALASIVQTREGARFAEPCSGAGAMAIATAREMRSRGLDPSTVMWALNDIDPIAVALSGVNAAANGLGPHVVLRCGDGLTWGLDDLG